MGDKPRTLPAVQNRTRQDAGRSVRHAASAHAIGTVMTNVPRANPCLALSPSFLRHFEAERCPVIQPESALAGAARSALPR